MTSTEKIANAKKRINELEALIEYWDNTKKKELGTSIKRTSVLK
tara:strand:- start:597 stop:728 length:132 start_codon:yes stop_codon:yes gene_type:complete